MSSLADQTIAALRQGHDQLAARVAEFGPDDLTRQSGASEWPVSQVLSHLGSGAEIALATLTAAQTGGPVPNLDSNRLVWARWDAMSPAEHAEGFLAANQTLVKAYESLDDGTREELRVDLGFLPAPIDVATAARFRLSEFTLHHWDVAVAFDPAATLAPEAVPLLLAQVDGIMGWIAKPDRLEGRAATLALRLRDPDRSLGLRLGKPTELTEAPEQSDGELALPAEAWLRLATGRLGPRYEPDGVTLTGPITLDELRQVFPGL